MRPSTRLKALPPSRTRAIAAVCRLGVSISVRLLPASWRKDGAAGAQSFGLPEREGKSSHDPAWSKRKLTKLDSIDAMMDGGAERFYPDASGGEVAILPNYPLVPRLLFCLQTPRPSKFLNHSSINSSSSTIQWLPRDTSSWPLATRCRWSASVSGRSPRKPLPTLSTT